MTLEKQRIDLFIKTQRVVFFFNSIKQKSDCLQVLDVAFLNAVS